MISIEGCRLSNMSDAGPTHLGFPAAALQPVPQRPLHLSPTSLASLSQSSPIRLFRRGPAPRPRRALLCPQLQPLLQPPPSWTTGSLGAHADPYLGAISSPPLPLVLEHRAPILVAAGHTSLLASSASYRGQGCQGGSLPLYHGHGYQPFKHSSCSGGLSPTLLRSTASDHSKIQLGIVMEVVFRLNAAQESRSLSVTEVELHQDLIAFLDVAMSDVAPSLLRRFPLITALCNVQ